MSTIKVQNIQHTGSSTNAIALASDGTCTANITNNLSNRNLIINGAMQVAQRGTTSTTQNAYTTVDRWKNITGGLDEGVTTAQSDITSGLAYNSGFRKAYKIQNGNQTSGAGTSDYVIAAYNFESQDLANSGWDYVSSSSFITISFYVKSSVAQTFQVQLYNNEPATSKQYVFEYSATTSWTRITHTVPGNSGLEIDNDNQDGFSLYFNLFHGTQYTNNSYVNNQWNDYGGGNPQYKDNTSTWYTTNDATWEITGLQFEVGSVATDFEHRSFAQEIQLCKRYYQMFTTKTTDTHAGINVFYYTSNRIECPVRYEPKMRTTPSLDQGSGTNYFVVYSNNQADLFDSFGGINAGTDISGSLFQSSGISGTGGHAGGLYLANANAYIAFNAEL